MIPLLWIVFKHRIIASLVQQSTAYMCPPKMTGKYYRIYILANYAELYLGWNYSSIISLLGFRKAFLGFSTQYLIVFRRSMFVIPTGMQYGYYLSPDRYTGDQVPWQIMHLTHTSTHRIFLCVIFMGNPQKETQLWKLWATFICLA